MDYGLTSARVEVTACKVGIWVIKEMFYPFLDQDPAKHLLDLTDV